MQAQTNSPKEPKTEEEIILNKAVSNLDSLVDMVIVERKADSLHKAIDSIKKLNP